MSDRSSPTRLPAYILAGGQSRRFGSDKARAELAGQPLIVRIARQLEPVAASITVVADAPDKYADLGLTTIADQRPGVGPITGLATALAHLQTQQSGDWLLLAACDLVHIRPQWVAQLQARATPPTAAVAFRAGGGRADARWEPLLALYHLSIASLVRHRLDRGDLAMHALLDAVPAAAVALPPDWPDLSQINTPGEHRRARETHAPLD